MFSIIFSSILIFSSLGFAKASRDFIVGGQEVNPPDPIQASTVGIFTPSGDGRSGSLCTGTLIRKDMALTAAHCVPRGIAKPTLIFGPDLHAPTAPRREAAAVAVNPKWDSSAGKGMDQGDIALIKFRGGLPDGYRTVRPVSDEKTLAKGSAVTLAGYGINDARMKSGAGRLRKTSVSVLQNRPGRSEMILDQSHGRGACHGDSGGPAFINQKGRIRLAGVTNRSYPNSAPDDCAHQSVYTKVPAYRNWIRDSEKKLEATGDANGRLKLKTKRAPAARRVKTATGRSHVSRQVASSRHYSRSPKKNPKLRTRPRGQKRRFVMR